MKMRETDEKFRILKTEHELERESGKSGTSMEPLTPVIQQEQNQRKIINLALDTK